MSLNKLAKQVQKKGRNGDTQLVHMTRGEVAGLSALAKHATGKPLPRNPDTGLPEASVLKSMLPTILGFAANFVVPGSGMLVGAATGALTNKQDPLTGALLGGVGGMGGGQLAAGLTTAGANAAASGVAGAATDTAAQTAATEAAKSAAQQNIAQQAMGLSAEQAAQNTASSMAANGPASTIAGRAGLAMDGFKSLGSMDGMKAFVGSAADKAAGTAATGMGGGYEAMMAAGKAAAPLMMAQPQGGGGEEEAAGEIPEYRYDAGYTGGQRLAGSGETSQRKWFDHKFTRMADGGAVPPPQRDVPQATAQPALPPQQMPGKPPEALWQMRPYGPGTSPGGMSGQSRDAFEYLMGRGGRQPTAPVPAPAPAPMPDMGTGIGGLPTYDGNDATNRWAPETGGGRGGTNMVGIMDNGQQIGRHQVGIGLPGEMGEGFGDDLGSRWQYRRYGEEREFADGGAVGLESGGFVIPADVVAAAGAGSSNAGMEALAKKLGAKPIQGSGDGQSDSIPASIDGKHKARVARDEMMLTRQQVAQLGGGDGAKGAKKLYAMMDRIRKQATGHTKQMRPVKLDKAMK